MSAPATIPPPSAEAKALRAIGAELDVMSEGLTSIDASMRTLADMSADDAKEINSKLDRIINLLIEPGAGLLPRVAALEVWRGEHVREHAQ